MQIVLSYPAVKVQQDIFWQYQYLFCWFCCYGHHIPDQFVGNSWRAYEPHTAKTILQRKKVFLSNHRLKFFYREMLLLSTQRSGKCSFKGKRCRLGDR